MLNLASNSLSNDGTDISGIESLCEALRVNSSLSSLDVKLNNLGESEKQLLLAAVAATSTRRDLTLRL